ncbi:MAG: hypothetical protein JST04_07130 [Bdellovibrionales bacterium]|nr:hypothetical protein [Bdellovibrionales bacterium]
MSSLQTPLAISLSLGIGTAFMPSVRAEGPALESKYCSSFLHKARLKFIDANVANLSNTAIRVEDGEKGTQIELRLGRRVGRGTRGAFYPIENPEVLGLSAEFSDWGVKIPHSTPFLRTFKDLDPSFNGQATREEFRLFSKLTDLYAEAAKLPEFPHAAAWSATRFPTLDIERAIEHELGFLLVKRKLRGAKSLMDLGDEGLRELPPEMVESLEDVFAMSAAIEKASRARGAVIYLDIAPSNLLWVSESEDLAALSMKKPGFVLVEADVTPGNQPFYSPSTMTLEKFLFRAKRRLTKPR